MKATAEQRAAMRDIAASESNLDVIMAFTRIVAAWQAEHLDDDEELATWEWLRDVMGWYCPDDSALRTPAGARELLAWRDSDGDLAIGVWSSGTRIPFLFNPTRRQVRLLVEALED